MKFCLACVYFLSAARACFATDAIPAHHVPCAAADDSIETAEYQEVTATQVELLQVQVKHTKINKADLDLASTGIGVDLTDRQDLETTGGNHRYFLCRPCARLAGDGMSGLPRHLVTGECCGDSVCSSDANWENHETCPEDCKDDATLDESQEDKSRVLSPPTESTLFGTLQGMPHDVYHCSNEDGTHVSGCSRERDYSVWLESLLDRAKNGTLPFDLPPPGSIAVEVGCGKGQDSRNIASMAGYALTAIDVSPGAIEEAKRTTPKEMLGVGPGQIEFVAYDALALPVPLQRVDFFFDATVYCGLRHEYLARLYGVWSRIFTPGHTLVHIQCWNWEFADPDSQIIPRTHRDMEADFEPFFDILHSESCEKNQDGPGWCFYMKLKAGEIRERTSEERLKLQQAARVGDIEYVSQHLPHVSKEVSGAYITTLYYIAMFNSHGALMEYLESVSPKRDDPFFTTVYGTDAEMATVEAEDRFLSNINADARQQLALMKADWERAEAELILQQRLDMRARAEPKAQDTISLSQNNIGLKPTGALTPKLTQTNVTSDELDKMELACNMEQDELDCGLVRQLIEYVDVTAIQDNVSSVIEAVYTFTKKNPELFGIFTAVSEITRLITKKGTKVGAELGSRLGYSALNFAPLMAQSPYYTVDPALGKARALLFAKAGISDMIANFEGISSDFLRAAAQKKLQFDYMLFDYLSTELLNDVQLALDLNLLSPGALIVIDDANKLFMNGVHAIGWLRGTQKFRSVRPYGELKHAKVIATLY